MTATYKPAIKASDDPAFDPASGLFRPSAGGGAFDIDSIYGVSDGGDFFVSITDQFTDAGTTPATNNGDLVYQWNGQRTTGTNINVIQATAGSRPELAADGTYTQSTYWPGGSLKWITEEAFNSPIKLWGVRFRLHAISTGTDQSRGASFMGQDFSPFSQTPGISSARDIAVAGGTRGNSTTVIADTDWHTLVVAHDGTDFNVYFDDMATPDFTHTTTLGNLINFRTGFTTGYNHGLYIHRMMAHTTHNAATPADIASWLEAS